jgi:hypothetical protein
VRVRVVLIYHQDHDHPSIITVTSNTTIHPSLPSPASRPFIHHYHRQHHDHSSIITITSITTIHPSLPSPASRPFIHHYHRQHHDHSSTITITSITTIHPSLPSPASRPFIHHYHRQHHDHSSTITITSITTIHPPLPSHSSIITITSITTIHPSLPSPASRPFIHHYHHQHHDHSSIITITSITNTSIITIINRNHQQVQLARFASRFTIFRHPHILPPSEGANGCAGKARAESRKEKKKHLGRATIWLGPLNLGWAEPLSTPTRFSFCDGLVWCGKLKGDHVLFFEWVEVFWNIFFGGDRRPETKECLPWCEKCGTDFQKTFVFASSG